MKPSTKDGLTQVETQDRYSRAGYIKLQRCERDGHRLLSQGLATIVRIAQSDSVKTALEAGQWLVRYGEDLMREKAAKAAESMRILAPPSDRETILNELKGLYAKALGSSSLIVEAEPESLETERS